MTLVSQSLYKVLAYWKDISFKAKYHSYNYVLFKA